MWNKLLSSECTLSNTRRRRFNKLAADYVSVALLIAAPPDDQGYQDHHN